MGSGTFPQCKERAGRVLEHPDGGLREGVRLSVTIIPGIWSFLFGLLGGFLEGLGKDGQMDD